MNTTTEPQPARSRRYSANYRTTELGEERLCPRCREFWPNDAEFFPLQNGRTRTPCRACFPYLPSEVRKREKRKAQRRQQRDTALT